MNADPKSSAWRALIVHAHPEPASFNAALRDVAVRTPWEGGAERWPAAATALTS